MGRSGVGCSRQRARPYPLLRDALPTAEGGRSVHTCGGQLLEMLSSLSSASSMVASGTHRGQGVRFCPRMPQCGLERIRSGVTEVTAVFASVRGNTCCTFRRRGGFPVHDRAIRQYERGLGGRPSAQAVRTSPIFGGIELLHQVIVQPGRVIFQTASGKDAGRSSPRITGVGRWSTVGAVSCLDMGACAHRARRRSADSSGPRRGHSGPLGVRGKSRVTPGAELTEPPTSQAMRPRGV